MGVKMRVSMKEMRLLLAVAVAESARLLTTWKGCEKQKLA